MSLDGPNGQVFIVSAARTPIGKFAGTLADTPATTLGGICIRAAVDRVCGSGLKAIMLGAAEIRAGDAEIIVAGGMENMNQGPYLLPKARFGYRLGNAEL